MMIANVYVNRNGTILVPTAAQTEAGYWVAIEPVEIASDEDRQSIVQALKKVWGRKNEPRIPTRDVLSRRKPVLLEHSKARSLRAFEAQHTCWTLEELPQGGFRIYGYKKAADSYGMEADLANSRLLPANTDVHEVFEIFAQIIAGRRGGAPFA